MVRMSGCLAKMTGGCPRGGSTPGGDAHDARGEAGRAADDAGGGDDGLAGVGGGQGSQPFALPLRSDAASGRRQVVGGPGRGDRLR
ncbi:MAG: hypothetical protein AVDCRST_MAG19-180 [uncultured Thermomicrobiales bacterium]|uniref:Uncharacterized protein n=1 Tax=uncultured Thermomicrobiales bacterium TaxID=1645740 RepID=A0A6J4UA03_9BACT|nr:MAG: hypothetical protein AVDCRST_MAG19-180 [uncultured Thermomicrobiales bacterium]